MRRRFCEPQPAAGSSFPEPPRRSPGRASLANMHWPSLLRHLLQLRHDGVSAREIGRRLGVARSTIQDNLKRAAAAGLAWPLADDFGRASVTQGQRRRVEPDWAALARGLKRPGVTATATAAFVRLHSKRLTRRAMSGPDVPRYR